MRALNFGWRRALAFANLSSVAGKPRMVVFEILIEDCMKTGANGAAIVDLLEELRKTLQ